jgi:hypothetical protein
MNQHRSDRSAGPAYSYLTIEHQADLSHVHPLSLTSTARGYLTISDRFRFEEVQHIANLQFEATYQFILKHIVISVRVV